jgi:nitrogen fixation NifU-like protein
MENSEWVYTENLKSHFMNPKNVLSDDDKTVYDGKGMVGNLKCGDQMLMVVKIDKVKGVIADCKWKTYGCASAIASTSVLSEMVIGMKIEDAYKLSPKDVTAKLGGLPEHKIHCSVLGDKALRSAINDYYEKNGMHDKILVEEAKIICQCMNVTDHEIEHAVLEGARTFVELQEHTKLGTVCGQCKNTAEKLLQNYIEKHFK